MAADCVRQLWWRMEGWKALINSDSELSLHNSVIYYSRIDKTYWSMTVTALVFQWISLWTVCGKGSSMLKFECSCSLWFGLMLTDGCGLRLLLAGSMLAVTWTADIQNKYFYGVWTIVPSYIAGLIRRGSASFSDSLIGFKCCFFIACCLWSS